MTPGQEPTKCKTISTKFLEGPKECIFTFDIVPSDHSNTSTPILHNSYNDETDPREEVQLIQAKINSLCEAQVLAVQKGKNVKKVKFHGVEIIQHTGPPC